MTEPREETADSVVVHELLARLGVSPSPEECRQLVPSYLAARATAALLEANEKAVSS